MKAAIERIRGEILSRDHFAAWLGFRELGYELSYFERGGTDTLPRDPEVVVVGGIASIWRALERLGLPRPELASVPPELLPLAGRRLWTATLGEVRRGAETGAASVFIKPLPHQHKLFTGLVVCHWRDLIAAAGLPDTLPVLCSEIVRFRGEYRGFVYRGELIGCKHYNGSFRVCPDFGVLDRAVAAFASAPAAYALDVGVTEDGRTLLVEANDGYALGSYGLEPVLYARLLAERWHELVRDPGGTASSG